MLMFLNGKEIAAEDLKNKLDKLNMLELIELMDVDENGNLYFETNIYGIYY